MCLVFAELDLLGGAEERVAVKEEVDVLAGKVEVEIDGDCGDFDVGGVGGVNGKFERREFGDGLLA